MGSLAFSHSPNCRCRLSWLVTLKLLGSSVCVCVCGCLSVNVNLATRNRDDSWDKLQHPGHPVRREAMRGNGWKDESTTIKLLMPWKLTGCLVFIARIIVNFRKVRILCLTPLISKYCLITGGGCFIMQNLEKECFHLKSYWFSDCLCFR